MVDISGALGSLATALPSTQEILNQVALTAATGIVVAGIKQQAANGSLDPLGLFPKQNPPSQPVAITPIVTPHAKVAASVWSTLSTADKAQLQAAGVEIVAG